MPRRSWRRKTGSFLLAVPAGLAAAGVAGMLIEFLVIRKLYARDHLRQVLATFGLILFINEMHDDPVRPAAAVRRHAAVPRRLGRDHSGHSLSGLSASRSWSSASLVAVGLYLLINKTRIGMLVRAGATHREMVRALGVDIRLLYTVRVRARRAARRACGLMAGPLLAVQVGMGEQILILTFVVVVIGGVGSIRGAFYGALIVGIVDTHAARLPAGAAHARHDRAGSRRARRRSVVDGHLSR